MILKKIKIMNYRQLESVELDMQESLTVLVGPNNSGKTTLISVLKGMFCDKKLGFSYSDIPISLSSMWLEKTVPVFQEIMLEYDKEKGVQKIIDEMTDNDKLSKDYTIDNFRAQIQVDYDPDSDNIQYFADYLMDLDDTKHSFYFIYTYEPSITAFERMVGLDSLRVIRQTEKSRSELFDLSKFRNSIKKEKIENLDDESEFLLANFFDWFFEIGYSELIFADKVILYEGDSERLYIRKLIKLPEFLPLNDSYIAFIQVGGAYAHNYLPILRMLKMKTLIITDLDYDKKNLSMEEVKAKDSNSTNATINYCYRVAHPDREEKYVPTIKELYDFQVEGKNILYNGLVYLAFQDENSTARTLEEAMLKKILKVDVFHMIKRSEWKKIRKDKKLTFSIPDNKEGEKDSEYSIRKIVEATSNNKTDFMYSVILSENEEKMLPDYIKKGLLWLMK